MAVISITLTESTEQIVAEIPRSIEIETNIPATIFYTLDGSDPTISSNIYTSAITLSNEQLSITLKIFATNGTDSSSIFSKTYTTNILNNTRLAHAAVSGIPSASISNRFPFGTNSTENHGQYQNNSRSGINVDAPDQPGIYLGFDGSGNQAGKIDSTDPYVDYKFKFTTTDNKGQTGQGIGNLPSDTTVTGNPYPTDYSPEESYRANKLFNPKAMVIFQDASTEDPTNPPMINRQFYSVVNPETYSDGNLLSNVGPENNQVSGTFLRNHFNPRTQEMTYYYRDSVTNKWIISTQPYRATNDGMGNLGDSVIFPRVNSGAGIVITYNSYGRRRILF